jgi:hypothetical protein
MSFWSPAEPTLRLRVALPARLERGDERRDLGEVLRPAGGLLHADEVAVADVVGFERFEGAEERRPRVPAFAVGVASAPRRA